MWFRLYWNWHTCNPYALEHPRTIGVSALYKSRGNGSEGSLKYKFSEGSPQTKNINRRSGPIDIHRRVVHKLNNISTVGAAQLIFIHRRVVHKQIIYINRRSGPIDIYSSEGCPLIN